jgi:hypothetical protein
MGVGFFAVLAERIVDIAGNGEHLVIAEVRGQIAEVKNSASLSPNL